MKNFQNNARTESPFMWNDATVENIKCWRFMRFGRVKNEVGKMGKTYTQMAATKEGENSGGCTEYWTGQVHNGMISRNLEEEDIGGIESEVRYSWSSKILT